MRRRLVLRPLTARILAVSALVACHDEPHTPVGPARPAIDSASTAVSATASALDPIGGLAGIAFLPPIAQPDPSTWGTFDGTLVDLLAVEICEVQAGSCTGAPLRRITSKDPLPAQLRVVRSEAGYRAVWDTRADNLDPSHDYRLRIVSGGQELAHADLDVVRRIRTDSTRCRGCVPILLGSTLSVVFRVDSGVAVRVGPTGGKVSLAAGNVTFDVPAGAVSGDVLFTASPSGHSPPAVRRRCPARRGISGRAGSPSPSR